jgi:hypothetical protein
MTKDPTRPTVVLRKVTRHAWGPDPARVVVVAVVQEGGRRWARVIGAEGGRAVELERAEEVEILHRRPTTLRLADGTEWEVRSPGCSCNVPGPLRGVNPLSVPMTEG